jgi:hypothetical protein
MMCPCFSTLLYAYIRVKSNLPALMVIIQVVAGIHEIWCSNENSILYSCMNAYSRDTKLSVNPPLHLACLQLSGMDIFWSETVMGLIGRIGKPIRVRLGIRLDPFLWIKLVSLYKERTCTSWASNENINLLGLAPLSLPVWSGCHRRRGRAARVQGHPDRGTLWPVWLPGGV